MPQMTKRKPGVSPPPIASPCKKTRNGAAGAHSLPPDETFPGCEVDNATVLRFVAGTLGLGESDIIGAGKVHDVPPELACHACRIADLRCRVPDPVPIGNWRVRLDSCDECGPHPCSLRERQWIIVDGAMIAVHQDDRSSSAIDIDLDLLPTTAQAIGPVPTLPRTVSQPFVCSTLGDKMTDTQSITSAAGDDARSHGGNVQSSTAPSTGQRFAQHAFSPFFADTSQPSQPSAPSVDAGGAQNDAKSVDSTGGLQSTTGATLPPVADNKPPAPAPPQVASDHRFSQHAFSPFFANASPPFVQAPPEPQFAQHAISPFFSNASPQVAQGPPVQQFAQHSISPFFSNTASASTSAAPTHPVNGTPVASAATADEAEPRPSAAKVVAGQQLAQHAFSPFFK